VLDPDSQARIPEAILVLIAEMLAASLPPAGIDRLAFVLTPGLRRPRGDRRAKARAWLRAVNAEAPLPPLEVLGRAIAAVPVEYLDAPQSATPHLSNRQWLDAALHAAGLRFVPPDRVVRASADRSGAD
jgi:hypothetical protein